MTHRNANAVDDAIDEHRNWVELYNETTVVASANYPDPVTQQQREAYMTLPDLIERCKEAWEQIPAGLRSVHYLVSVQP